MSVLGWLGEKADSMHLPNLQLELHGKSQVDIHIALWCLAYLCSTCGRYVSCSTAMYVGNYLLTFVEPVFQV